MALGISFRGKDLHAAWLDGTDGVAVNIKDELAPAVISIRFGRQLANETGWGDTAQRYEEHAPADGEIRISGIPNLLVNASHVVQSNLFAAAFLNPAGTRSFAFQVATDIVNLRGFRISGECKIEVPSLNLEPATREHTLADIIFRPAGRIWPTSGIITSTGAPS